MQAAVLAVEAVVVGDLGQISSTLCAYVHVNAAPFDDGNLHDDFLRGLVEDYVNFLFRQSEHDICQYGLVDSKAFRGTSMETTCEEGKGGGFLDASSSW